MVRAKFRVDTIELSIHHNYEKQEDGSPKLVPVEKRTIVMHPVSANNDPNHENSKFWAASPTGELKLGTINPEAWKQFEIGKEYYLDFTSAD